jgi:hypothetical protein
MTNKIHQEIENIIINEVIRDERNLGQYARNEIPLLEFIKKAYNKGFKAGQKQSEGKLTLNHKCPLCNKNIFLGDDIVIQKRIVYHLKCYDKEKNEDD